MRHFTFEMKQKIKGKNVLVGRKNKMHLFLYKKEENTEMNYSFQHRKMGLENVKFRWVFFQGKQEFLMKNKKTSL